ncbi:MAG: hypothetical protein Q4P24_07405 [Rhodobacterales bacterium]|nr:hypothetical protein [Rhodobacterales bacterium]
MIKFFAATILLATPAVAAESYTKANAGIQQATVAAFASASEAQTLPLQFSRPYQFPSSIVHVIVSRSDIDVLVERDLLKVRGSADDAYIGVKLATGDVYHIGDIAAMQR